MKKVTYQKLELIYDNKLMSETDTKDFILEGTAKISFDNGRMRMQNLIDPSEGQKSNFVYWCPQDFPDNIEISWDFYPISEPGLCILFFAATGQNGQSILSDELNKRTGEYPQYHHGDINALHVSYFRRKAVEERAFNLCNLRKSYGFHMVAQGADPIPATQDAIGPYRIKVVKKEKQVVFFINELQIFEWEDDGVSYGKILTGGKIGFRQMAPLIGEYANLTVYSII